MTIKTYKFSYEATPNSQGILMNDNYVNKAKNHIIESIDDPNFVFPKYFRVSVVYSPKEEISDDKILRWRTSYKKFVDGVSQGKGNETLETPNYERYTYNNRDLPLEYPESQVSDRVGLDNFHPIDEDYLQITIANKGSSETWFLNTLVCSVIVTYSDDDPKAGNEYVEPKKLKQYLVSLDFGSRKSRRNKSNRRKYRNRY